MLHDSASCATFVNLIVFGVRMCSWPDCGLWPRRKDAAKVCVALLLSVGSDKGILALKRSIQLLCWVKDQHHVDAGGFPGFHLLWRTGAADISVFMTQARLIPPATRSLPSPLSQLLAHVFLMNCREKIALENLEAYLDGFSGYEISTTLPSASFPLRHLPPSSPCCLHSGHTGLLLLLKHPRLGLPDKIQVSQ